MKIFAVVASGMLALGLTTGGASAKDAIGQINLQQIVATMNNVEWTTKQIGQIRNVSDVTLVQLDDSMAANGQALIGALAAQQGTAQVDALRAAVAGNGRLVDELRRQHVEYMNIVAIDIGQTGRITIYTLGASA
jgi:Skp family chaperone for outer membrane proteins